MEYNEIIKYIFTENGIVGVLLSVAVLYQSKQLAGERSKNEKLNSLILQLATSQVSANKEIQAVLERLIDLLPKYIGGYNVK